MRCNRAPEWRRSLGCFLPCALLAALVACGGGGNATTTATPDPPVAIEYPNSVVLGATALQRLDYTPGVGAVAATLTASTSTTLLRAGRTSLIAEHREALSPGLVLACVSGRGDSTNVIIGINLGVITQSAAVLFDATWHPVDTESAWSDATLAGRAWVGWENCGAKPEGSPSPSSRLFPAPDSGYAEDIYDGNPSTSFNSIRRPVVRAEVQRMISADGLLTSEDPLRPLRLTLRAYADGAGHRVFVEVGEPVPGAPISARGFIGIYFPG